MVSTPARMARKPLAAPSSMAWVKRCMLMPTMGMEEPAMEGATAGTRLLRASVTVLGISRASRVKATKAEEETAV